jgi:mRNA interferase HigB
LWIKGKNNVHIITKKRIIEAKLKHKTCATTLNGWYAVISKNTYTSFSELKRTFNTVDKVKHLYVFDIGGNKLRLIASIHFNRQKLYVRDILTHKEYDEGKWRS